MVFNLEVLFISDIDSELGDLDHYHMIIYKVDALGELPIIILI